MDSQPGRRRSKAIQRQTGRTFHVATRLLPERVREPTYVLYAFFRIADDIVDDEHPPPPDEQRHELEALRAAALGQREPDDPVLAAVTELTARHDIPREEIDTFVDAMGMDIDTTRYRSHDDLAAYLRGSAVAVGHMMLEVMDPDQKATARPHAAALGEAFQLTNFLRDVREDIRDYDRIYLPESTLAAHGVSHEAIEQQTFSEGFAAAIREELAVTERLYDYGVSGIQYLPADCQLPVLAAAVMYADHHRLIREQGFDVLSERPSLSMRRRLSLVARTWLRWQFDDDPRSVFYRLVDFDPPARSIDGPLTQQQTSATATETRSDDPRAPARSERP